jgi:malonyl-CoA O-methyltransferase
MPIDPRERSARRPLDEVALGRVVQRLQRADAAPWLHGEVARRMAERLPLIRLQPEVIADWWAHLGGSGALLARAYPRAQRILVEPSPERRGASAAALARPWWSPARWSGTASRVCTEAELAPGSVQLLWSNMGLHWALDPQAVMRQWQRALRVDGFLMFSSLGPGSLGSLRELYRAQGWPSPFASFVDMHDLGDMLVEAGFADPVMDQERLTLTWASPAALLSELRRWGGNADPGRYAGLRTPGWRTRLQAALLDTACTDGRIALDFEIVYGHAFRPAPRVRVASETTLALADLRAMVRSGRP